MPAYIPANKTLSVRVVILSRDNLKKKSIDKAFLCLEDNNGTKIRVKIMLRNTEKASVLRN
jgi:hypothetical protein